MPSLCVSRAITRIITERFHGFLSCKYYNIRTGYHVTTVAGLLSATLLWERAFGYNSREFLAMRSLNFREGRAWNLIGNLVVVGEPRRLKAGVIWMDRSNNHATLISFTSRWSRFYKRITGKMSFVSQLGRLTKHCLDNHSHQSPLFPPIISSLKFSKGSCTFTFASTVAIPLTRWGNIRLPPLERTINKGGRSIGF